MNVRRARATDLDAILRIEAASEGAAHWRRGDYRAMLERPGDWLLIVEDGEGTPIGFLAARTAADEAEILNLAVDPAARRQGAGRSLVEEVIRLASEGQVARLFLEVRTSQEGARAFYRANGFRELNRRRDYYKQPREDAIVLVREVKRSG